MGMIINPFAFAAASPIPTNNLFLWLKPDAGVSIDGENRVLEWADQSGNGINFVPSGSTAYPIYSANTFNGYGGVYFSGGTQFLTGGTTSTFNFLQGSPNSGHTIYWVWWIRPGQANNALGRLLNNTNSASARGYYLGWETSSPSNINEIETFVSNGGGTPQLRINSGNNTYWPGVLTRCQDLVTSWGNAGTDRTISASGTSKGTANTAAAPSATDPLYAMMIGARQPYLDQPFNGYVVEVIVYNINQSAGDQTTVNDYLKAKYSIS